MTNSKQDKIIVKLKKAGMTENDILKGINIVFKEKYTSEDIRKLTKDIQGNPASNYNKDMILVKKMYDNKSITKNIYDKYVDKKPAGMVLGYSVYDKIDPEMMTDEFKRKYEAFLVNDMEEWTEGSV